MAESFLSMFLTQLMAQAPMLIAYLVGLILAIVFWHRHPRPSLFAVLSMILFLVSTLVQSLLFVYLITARNMDPDWSSERLGWMLSINSIAGNVLRAGALALLFVAVYIGRDRTQ